LSEWHSAIVIGRSSTSSEVGGCFPRPRERPSATDSTSLPPATTSC
jgi:hypothetical protein